MYEKIRDYLNEIQQDRDIEILLACETGSRAWGFPSPDSDFDVRFIYRHKREWYLSLNERKDTIELMRDNNEIDLSGWDLKKSLGLLWKSNPPLLERIQSPVIYMVNDAFLKGINDIAAQTYSKIASMHHYLSMAKKMFTDINGHKEIKLKKLFYALRTSVACQWIMERDEMPPIVFQTMLEKLDIDAGITGKIYQLIELKSSKSEGYFHQEETMLNEFIERIIMRSDDQAQKLPSAKANMEELNTFFRKMLVD